MRRVTLKRLGYWAVQQALDGVRAGVSLVESRVKVSATDSTGDYLEAKLVAGQGLSRTILNPGAVEQYRLDALSAQHELIVDPSGEFDDTSIAAAIITAIAGGASAVDPWLVTVKPGTYVEPPMVIPPGIAVVSQANRIDTAFVVASSSSQDLFTCSGGYLAGLSLSGVTDPTKALIRCATASSLVVMHGVSWRNCSDGIVVEGGASAILTNCSININGAGQAIDTAIICRDAGSFLGVTGLFVSVPAAVLALYPGVNPVQCCVCVSGAEATLSNVVIHAAYNVGDNVGVLADDGAFVVMFSADVEDCFYGTQIGTNGVGTYFNVQAANFHGNDWNGDAGSATGVYQVSASADAIKFSAVAGARLNGVIQVSGVGETLIAGDSSYLYASQKQTALGGFIHDVSLTGSTMGGVVTDAGGLDVDVAAGEGYSTRHAPDHDTQNVSWAEDLGVGLTDDATNYVFFDPVASSIDVALASPGVDKVLLSVVETVGGDIIYLHDTRVQVMQPAASLHDYLLSTRRIAWETGVATSGGTLNANIDVSAGSWYRAWEILSVAGGSDVTWAYYYGSGGGLTRVAGVSAVNTAQYDFGGVLTAIPGGEYKADTLIVTSDNRFTLIYGTDTYASQALAEDGANKAAMPDFLAETGCYLALVVSGPGPAGTVVSHYDIRPDPNAATAGGGGGGAPPTAHSGLTGLGADDHTQYSRTDGTRALTGAQSFGGNNATNVGTVNGVTVENHSARHNAGGADELAVATPASNGYMSAADKTKLDAVISPSLAEIYAATPIVQAGISAVPSKLATFDTNGIASNSTPDHTNDEITIGTTGQYKVSFSVSFTGNNNQTYTFEVAVDGVAQVNGACVRKLGTGADVGASGFDCLLSLTAAQVVSVLVSTGGTTITAQRCTLNVVRI